MRALTRNEFVTLLVSNPGKKFVFQEDWDNDTYDPSISLAVIQNAQHLELFT